MATPLATVMSSFNTPALYGDQVTVDLSDAGPWIPGTCLMIAPAFPQFLPYVGLVVAQDTTGNTVTIQTLSFGDIGASTMIPTSTAVSLGSPPGGFASGPGISGFPLNVFWPTDPTIYSDPATGGGIHDDSGAINNALTMAKDAGGGIVMLPAGTFRCDATLVIDGSSVHLWGVGTQATIIKQHVAAVQGSNPAVILVTGNDVSLRHFTIQGVDGAGVGASPGPLASNAQITLPM